MSNSLIHFDEERYRLLAWCVMPSHVHVLLVQIEGWGLSTVVHGWKSFTSHMINRAVGRRGAVWARDYFDRAMRNEAQVEAAKSYIEYDPVAAALCREPQDWRWSSASKDAGETPAVQG